jgi:hypothetical protein
MSLISRCVRSKPRVHFASTHDRRGAMRCRIDQHPGLAAWDVLLPSLRRAGSTCRRCALGGPLVARRDGGSERGAGGHMAARLPQLRRPLQERRRRLLALDHRADRKHFDAGFRMPGARTGAASAGAGGSGDGYASRVDIGSSERRHSLHDSGLPGDRPQVGRCVADDQISPRGRLRLLKLTAEAATAAELVSRRRRRGGRREGCARSV